MHRLPKSLLLIFGLLCFVFTSCVDSDNPISDPKQATVDPGLLGVWRIREEAGNVTYYHVGRAGEKFPAGMLRVKTVTHEKNGVLPRPDNDDILVFTTTLGNNHYLNITSLNADRFKSLEKSNWEPSMAEGYFLYKYEIRGDKLVIEGMEAKEKEAAIKAGKIKGIIEENNVRIIDTTEKLARFIAAADQEKLFPAKRPAGDISTTLERVK